MTTTTTSTSISRPTALQTTFARVRIARLAATGALHGEELAFTVRAAAYALDSARVAVGLPPRAPLDARPIPAARLFALELAAPRDGGTLAAAAATVAPYAVAALREAVAQPDALDTSDFAASSANHAPSIEGAVALWVALLDGVFEALVAAKLDATLEHIWTRRPRAPDRPGQLAFDALADAPAPLYDNHIERLAVRFTVDRVPFASDVLDPRIVRIPPGYSSESHRHAHESLFYVVAGEGAITVGAERIAVRAGQCVFVPRWTMHQSHATGCGELRILGITDFWLTSKAQVGGDGQGRLKRAQAKREVTS